MPNSIIPQDQDGKNIFNAISAFFRVFMIGKLLHKCNAQKEKGVPVLDIFKYKLCNIFSGRSMYMQQRTGSYRENTFYRFLNNAKTNWMRFTSLLSKKVADAIEPLTNEDRVNAFVVDDSLFERTSCKKTELGSRVFDHTTMRYRKGFRLMTLGSHSSAQIRIFRKKRSSGSMEKGGRLRCSSKHANHISTLLANATAFPMTR